MLKRSFAHIHEWNLGKDSGQGGIDRRKRHKLMQLYIEPTFRTLNCHTAIKSRLVVQKNYIVSSVPGSS